MGEKDRPGAESKMCERWRREEASQEENASHVTQVISKNNIPFRSQFSRASKRTKRREKCEEKKKVMFVCVFLTF